MPGWRKDSISYNYYKKLLDWVNNRLQVLDEIEEKLYQMKQLAEMVQEGNLSQQQIEDINKEFKKLESEVNELDEKSKNYISH
ncbi:hypothetical protein SYNTR_1826 [Candidatus Syntrophocurvum alkaliphilum]|uniref:Uncharacterized protein n=1 Tax=Candidatus Syntrophocurvum alkaliphilum TaxID=2293317 RepID=A0A6I6DKA6_9FIRM|nr:hypothetical protein [Candidatus Syntrophocurvum alkaliphilum]QGU00420.1 hypothetical protein SYNTR_1826 [Candidatus Syntrophocurvum alkaliphilum]